MSDNNQHIAEELASIIQLLADVWPSDRENVAYAGAKFEGVMEDFDKSFGQLQKLANLAWEGIKHLYISELYFMSVKASTMHAVNMLREYVISDGDVKVEDFEKIYTELEKALNGGKETADKLIELDDAQIEAYQEERKHQKEEEAKQKAADDAPKAEDAEPLLPTDTTLDDLAAYLMLIDEASITHEQAERLAAFIHNSINNEVASVAEPLKEAYTYVKAVVDEDSVQKGWFDKVAGLIEEATNQESNAEWDASQEETAADEPVAEEVSAVVEKPVAEQPVAEPAPSPKVVKEVFIIPDDIEISMVGEFVTECNELIEMAESALLDLEDRPEDDELVNTIFRAFHTIKGTSAFMGLEPITEFTHHVETVLSSVRDGELKFDRACADINFESIDIIKQLLKVVEVSGGGDPLQTPDMFDSMLSVLIDVSENNVEPAVALAKIKGAAQNESVSEEIFEEAPAQAEAVVEEPVEADQLEDAVAEDEPVDPAKLVDAPASDSIKNAAKTPSKSDSRADDLLSAMNQKHETDSSVRVSVSRLDRLIDMVGELVIAHSVVAQDQNIPKDSELQKKVNHATKIIRELQDTSLTLRMVPLRATFHKMNRLVRDLSRKAGKPVKFITSGEDTEIDRNMVDVINEPLIHMLRNSLDHGIETPEERSKTDKPQVANLYLRAFQEGGKVVIQIQDDGRGINKDKILAKAIEKGLVEPDKKMTDAEIYGLIFLPGFSSAEKVTDLSGRGVGMDVVRRAIEALQGKVEVASELGRGTTITIELPFTLAITDGMLIKVGGERFIIPTINIDMTFRAEDEDLFTMLGESEQVTFRGDSVPVIRLNRLFEIDDAKENITDGTLLIIKNNNSRYALLVDEVIGQQQLVGKSISMIATTAHVSGGAILGDGKVGLILDTAALMTS